MPYVNRWEAPAEFHTFAATTEGDSVDVVFYHAYRGEHPLSNWFATDSDEYDGDIGPWDFDLRPLADALEYDRPETQDDKRFLMDRAVDLFLEGYNWDDPQSFKCIAHAVKLAGESAANAVPTQS